jgi:hypothetical protein
MGQYRPSTFKWVNLDPQLLFLDQTRFLLMWHSILKRKVYFVLSTSPSLLMCQSSPLLPQHDHFARPLVAASFSLLTTVILLPTAARNGERVSWHCCCCCVLISSSRDLFCCRRFHILLVYLVALTPPPQLFLSNMG